VPLVRESLSSGELVAPFKRTADPARAYYAIVSKTAGTRPEVADFVAWLQEESKKEVI
jgi:DNA-binding transcriptional LysR family regulator